LRDSPRPLDAIGVFVVVALCMSFGFNQVAVKLALPDIPPLIQSAIRSSGAALLVWLWMRLRGIPIDARRPTLVPGIIAGLLFGLEFILIYSGLVWTTASRAVVFLFLAPFFVVVGAHRFLPAERFGRGQWLGLILCFAGMALAFGTPMPAIDSRRIFGDVMMVGAAAAWAATTLVIKGSALNDIPPEKTLFYQLVVSAPVLAVGALVLGEEWPAAPVVAGGLAGRLSRQPRRNPAEVQPSPVPIGGLSQAGRRFSRWHDPRSDRPFDAMDGKRRSFQLESAL